MHSCLTEAVGEVDDSVELAGLCCSEDIVDSWYLCCISDGVAVDPSIVVEPSWVDGGILLWLEEDW